MVDLKGYEGKYKINECGNIINKKGHPMRSALGNTGYLRVALEDKNSTHRTNESVHRLVAQTFIENDDPINKNIVMHLDNDKLNNHVSNLKWGTQQENIQQAIDDGLKISARKRTKKLNQYSLYNPKTGEEEYYYGRQAIAEQIQYKEISLKNMVGNGREIALGPYAGWLIYRNNVYKSIIKPIYYLNENGSKYYDKFHNC